MIWCTQFLTSSQFLVGVHLIGICWNEIESCLAPLCDSQMLGTDGIHKARRSPCVDNASWLPLPQCLTCGNQTSQDEIPSSFTSWPVVSWKCFILQKTGKKKGSDGKQRQHWLLQEKGQHREGKTAHFFTWYRPSVTDKKVGCPIFVLLGTTQNRSAIVFSKLAS